MHACVIVCVCLCVCMLLEKVRMYMLKKRKSTNHPLCPVSSTLYQVFHYINIVWEAIIKKFASQALLSVALFEGFLLM